MRSCFVSIPFGIKRDRTGRTLDFDHLYAGVLQPAVEELEIACGRLDEFPSAGTWQKTMFTELVSSELVIVDVSTDNANVFYELGVRHALRRGRTLLISARGQLPGNIGYAHALFYDPGPDGRLVGEAAGLFRAGLQGAIRQSLRTKISDSPLYEFFPELEVDLPPELERNRRSRAKATKALKPLSQKMMDSLATVIDSSMRSIGSSMRGIDSSMQEIESAVRGAPDADTFDYLAVLRKYRDLSQWDRLIALADDAPADVAASPELKQMLALALNRRGHEGDRDRAIGLMEGLVSETGGDAETFGILGRIYKERYEHARAENDAAQAEAALERALHHFRAGFDKNPNDYYPGLSAITLLLESGGDAARPEIDRLLPRVRQAVQGRLEPGREGVWELSAALQLAAIARDWQAADGIAARLVEKASSPWMLQAAQHDLRTIGESFTGEGDRAQVAGLSEVLARGAAGREAA